MEYPSQGNQSRPAGKIHWYANRLRCMTPAEVLGRTQYAVSIWLKKRSHVRAIAAVPPDEHRFGHPWFEGSGDQAQFPSIKVAADKALHGEVSVFSLVSAELGSPPQWNRDPKTGVIAPLEFGLSMKITDQAKVGDIKYLWEPSRHQHLVPIAQAFALSRNECYRIGLIGLLDTWLDQCPYPLGPHWISPLEAAIRLINWSIIWHLLGATDVNGELALRHASFRRKWLDSIYWHIHFIIENLSSHSSANNHLLGELAGAFVGLTTWPCWSSLGGQRPAIWRHLQAEALVQNADDGVNREQAISYQQFAFDFLLIAGLCAKRNDLAVSSRYWQRLESMLEFVASLMDVSGNVPQFGDGDDGAACGLVPDRGNYRSILATGALLFARPAFARAAGEMDGKTQWLMGDTAAGMFERIRDGDAEDQLPRAFRGGGYYILGRNFGERDEVKAVFDVAPLGYLGIAAHGHADALSLVLSVSGEQALVDPGTFCYHGPLVWREHFRGTEAHNTVTVDGNSQSISGGRFMWVRHAKAQCTESILDRAHQSVTGSHDGYNSGRRPTIHRRRVQFIAHENRLVVTDQLDGTGSHAVATYWHFGKTIAASLNGNICHLEGHSCSITMRLSDDAEHLLHYPTEETPLGWISERYEAKSPGFVLISRQQCSPLTQWVTEFEIATKPGLT